MKQPLYTGAWGNLHLQGIAVDKKQGYIYYSFTTQLIKATLEGQIVGALTGLVGHLGCIAFNEEDGCVYGSLEYKNDSIGKGILRSLNKGSSFADAFYVACFDVARIDRLGIPAEGSDIMRCSYLKEVVHDYNSTGTDVSGKTVPHRYGCSGIDGITFGPLPGKSQEEGMYLYIAYGIYSDLTRKDNDHQILLCFDPADVKQYAESLDQGHMHTQGPAAPLHKFFVYTGNTTYGVQNLEYDPHTNAFFMAVYTGKKPGFPNYSLFAADASAAPEYRKLQGLEEQGEILILLPAGLHDEATELYGWHFPHGSTGLCSLGNGSWLIAEAKVSTAGQCGYIFQYIWDGKKPFLVKDR